MRLVFRGCSLFAFDDDVVVEREERVFREVLEDPSSSRICSKTIALLSTLERGAVKTNLICSSGLTEFAGVTLTAKGFRLGVSSSFSFLRADYLIWGAFHPNFRLTVSIRMR